MSCSQARRVVSRLIVSLVSSFVLVGSAQVVTADVVTIDTGEDTAPYSFLPNLARYNNPSLYAFKAIDDDTGVPHDFETYLWFDVTAADIPPGQYLDEALLVVTYAFDFTGFGETSTDPGILDCREVLGAWDHTTLTWANRPPVDVPFDTITEIDSFGALICDASAIVASWIYAGLPNNGFALTSPTPRVMGMNSFEAAVASSLKPTLYLTTEVPEPGFAVSLGVGLLALRGLGGRKRRGGVRPRSMDSAP